MSIIPLILKGSNPTVVISSEDFDKYNGINGTAVLIKDIDVAQFADTKNTNISYDLRVGEKYRDHRESEATTLSEKGQFEVHPGQAFIIETEETVHFPKSLFGYILPKVSKLQDGLSNTASKVDPGYNGTLIITVFNLGKKSVKLTRGETFCSLHISQIADVDNVRLYDKKGKQIRGEGKRTKWQKISDFLQRHDSSVKVLLFIVTAILTIIQIYQHI